MKNEKTILPNSILASLYKDTLVLPQITKKESELIDNSSKQITSVQSTKESIMEAPTPTHEVSNDSNIHAAPLKYLGEHLKQVTIIVKDDISVHLNETDLHLLSSILNACKLNLADIALINIAQQKLSLHEILETLPSKLVLIFDVSSTTLKVKLPTTLYKPIQLGETYLLFSNGLSKMQGTDQSAKVEKSKLWTVLKQLFQL